MAMAIRPIIPYLLTFSASTSACVTFRVGYSPVRMSFGLLVSSVSWPTSPWRKSMMSAMAFWVLPVAASILSRLVLSLPLPPLPNWSMTRWRWLVDHVAHWSSGIPYLLIFVLLEPLVLAYASIF